jgi:hypothetical protein
MTIQLVLVKISFQVKTLDYRSECYLSSDRIISLTDYFGSIVPRGTRGSGQKKSAGGFTG